MAQMDIGESCESYMPWEMALQLHKEEARRADAYRLHCGQQRIVAAFISKSTMAIAMGQTYAVVDATGLDMSNRGIEGVTHIK